MAGLLERNYTLKAHPAQCEYAKCGERFIINHSGRRSGKSEIAKRKLVYRACTFHAFPDGRFFACAPVQHQAERIYWNDLKAMVPRELVVSVSESDCTIKLVNGAMIGVVGLDKPERIEGAPIDGVLLDEFADMKPDVWTRHIRPGLSTPGRPGWAMFIGVPEGRNHFYELCERARQGLPGWRVFHWPSWEIVDPDEVAAAKSELDDLTFRQEYGGEFVNFEGRAYYSFDQKLHVVDWLEYDPALPINFCFDFNVDPGVAVVCQEQRYRGPRLDMADTFTACLGEVYIERNSNTERVCGQLAKEWRGHLTDVRCYGDASGGARKSSAVMGSDWDLIRQALKPVFGDRLAVIVPRANPPERVRINAVNSRLLSADGKVKMLIQGGKEGCPRLIKDLDGVTLTPDGSGQLDKKVSPALTHISDALGYHIAKCYPVRGGEAWAAGPLQL